MDKWEYTTVKAYGTGDSLNEINKLGKQGWEAVSSIGDTQQFLLKRKIPSAPTQSIQRPVQNQQINDDFGLSF